MFHIGANSKLFVAMAIGLLVNNETVLPNGATLGYGTKVKDILPDWNLADEYARDHLDLLDLLGKSAFGFAFGSGKGDAEV